MPHKNVHLQDFKEVLAAALEANLWSSIRN